MGRESEVMGGVKYPTHLPVLSYIRSSPLQSLHPIGVKRESGQSSVARSVLVLTLRGMDGGEIGFILYLKVNPT